MSKENKKLSKEELLHYIKLLEDDKYSDIPEELKYSLNINPNLLDYEYIKSTKLYSKLDNNFESFDGYKCLYVKHESQKEWYCYYVTNMWNNKYSMDYKIINCGDNIFIINDEEYDTFRLVRQIKFVV